MELQTAYLERLGAALLSEPRIRAAWLSGSFGRGDADRYSDIDLNLFLESTSLEAFRREAGRWLNNLGPLVLFTWMFNGRMANCLTVDGLRLDVWLHTEQPAALTQSRVRVLMDRDNALRIEAAPEDLAALAATGPLVAQISEFWRCIALVPAAAGRGEHIASFFGLGVEATLLADVLIAGYGIPRESGIKRLSGFLPEHLRREIEAALSFDGLGSDGLVQAALKLARTMHREGPVICERRGLDYPIALERAVIQYVTRELERLPAATND